jgi:WD40 repeat protein
MIAGRAWRWAGLTVALLAAIAAAFHTTGRQPGAAAEAAAERTEWVLGRPGDHPAAKAVCAAIDPAGRRVAIGSWAGEVAVWEADGPRPLWRWTAHPASTTAVALTPDGGMVLSAGSDMVLRLWALTAGGPVLRAEAVATGRVLGIAVAPDGRSAATGSVGSVTVWRVEGTGLTPAAETAVPGWPVHTLAFSTDGRRLAFAADDNVVRLWRPDGTGGPTAVGVSETYLVRGLGFTPGGGEVVALDTEGRLIRWDVGTGERRDMCLAVPTCRTAAFTADLCRAVIVHHVGSVRLVSLSGGPEDF